MTDKTNQVIISLLGKLAFPEEKLKEIVCKKKQDPAAYLAGYNACDGVHTVTEIAKIIGVTPGTLVPILQSWEKIGIIYETESKQGKTYKNLYLLAEDPNLKRKKKVEAVQTAEVSTSEIKEETIN